ncbi:MAG: 4-oxalocrotonate tautomerase [Azospirillum brasilense]|nr:MAG: 4-oxalocrotonate tautomerase [Azospirillum brasilense]
MPIVQINMLKGRTIEQKRALVKKVTEALGETIDAPPHKIRIILNDMEHDMYAIAGQLHCDADNT